MEIFHISKGFPIEEKYSLTDQVRRSSRSVTVTVSEAYRKRQYGKFFLNKVSDADMENTETQVWLDFAHQCSYIDSDTLNTLMKQSNEIGKLLNHMLNNPEKYLSKKEG